MATSPTFVIVGASLAGAKAAETLRTEGFDGRVVLLGEEAVRPYERPPLSKELPPRREADFDVAAVHGADYYDGQRHRTAHCRLRSPPSTPSVQGRPGFGRGASPMTVCCWRPALYLAASPCRVPTSPGCATFAASPTPMSCARP